MVRNHVSKLLNQTKILETESKTNTKLVIGKPKAMHKNFLTKKQTKNKKNKQKHKQKNQN